MRPHSCPKDERLRVRSGCDKPTEVGVWDHLCHVCFGQSKECPECEGVGRVAYNRCMNVEMTRQGRHLFKLYRVFKEHHVLPELGGLTDQDAKFINAVEHCDFISGLLNEEKERQAKSLKNLEKKSGK